MMNEMKKSVRFAPDDRLETVRTVACDNDVTGLYVSVKEFEQAKDNSLAEGCKARKEGLGELLESTFTKASPDVQKRLNQFIRHSEYRGVERWVSKSHYLERKVNRERAIQAVLIGQDMARTQALKPDETGEQLRKVALVYCVDAKVFARRLGKADEAACERKKRKGGDQGKPRCNSKVPSLLNTFTDRAHTAYGPLVI